MNQQALRQKQATNTTSRQCCICNIVKPLEDFPRHKRYPLGRHYRCCLCNAALAREYYQKNRQKELERRRAYGKGNKEYNAALSNRRRARLKGNGGRHTMKEWIALKEQYNNKCAICQGTKPLTRDHIVPLSKGGTDDISNIQPLCQSCNSRKGDK